MDQIAPPRKDLGQTLARRPQGPKGLTQAELAARAAFWQRTVSNIETGAERRQGGDDFDLCGFSTRIADRAAQQDDPALIRGQF